MSPLTKKKPLRRKRSTLVSRTPAKRASVRRPEPVSDIAIKFGERIRTLRQDRDMSQAEMARDFGLDRSWISDVERGVKHITLPLIEVIADGLKLSLSQLVKGL